jgi:hypothetical protein
MTTQFQSEDFDRSPALSQTAWALQELQLYGTRAFQDEVDLRPMPEPERLIDAVSDIFDALVATLGDTRMEPDLEELLWGQVNLFHRAAARTERLLDDNEVAQHRLQREQDGSEVKSTELERLTAEGTSLVERRHCLEAFRDRSAEAFELHTGSTWRPRSGSMVNHKHLTAALIDSRDFLSAKRRAETEVMLPQGTKIALTGGTDFNDHRLIWAKLDQVRTKYPDMILLHGGRAQNSSPPNGPKPARSRRSPSNPTGPNTPRPHPSSATTPCWTCCRWAFLSSQATASRKTSPTRPRSWASRF